MSFEPQNDLERSLMRAAGDPAYRPQFYKDLAAADLYIVQPGPPPQGEERTTLAADTEIQIESVAHDGAPHLVIYSSLPRLQASLSGEVAYLALNALELMKLTEGASLLLNPGAEFGKAFTPEEIASILDGSIWAADARYTVAKPVEVMLGQPKNYPTALVDALKTLFKMKKQIKRAWLAHIFNPDDGVQGHTLIGIEVSGQFDEVCAEAGLVVRNVTIPDPPVDFMQVNGEGGADGYFLNQSQPFYVRRFLGIF